MFAYILGLYLYIFVTRLRTIAILRDRMAHFLKRGGRVQRTATPAPWEQIGGKVKRE